MAIDDGVVRIEHTHKGEVVHKLDGIEKIDELARHIKTAGGGSQLSQAQSLAKAGFMAFNSDELEKACEKFEKALSIYDECVIAILGMALTAEFPFTYAEKLAELAPEPTLDEKAVLKDVADGLNSDVAVVSLLCTNLDSRVEYIFSDDVDTKVFYLTSLLIAVLKAYKGCFH